MHIHGTTPESSQRLFGGIDPAALAALVRGGFATWIDTDATDRACATAQAAVVVNAPVQTTYDTATDFAHFHEFLSLSKPSRVVDLGPNRKRITFRQRLGLAVLSVGLDLTFDMRFDPPNRVVCERYVDGAFSTAVFGMDLVALPDDSTLLIITFLADMQSLGWLVRTFLARIPELALAIEGNVAVLPATAFAAEAERRAGRSPFPGPPARALHEAIADGSVAVGDGLLTVGRLDPRGEILDVSAVTRVATSPEALWPALTAPERRPEFISVVDRGKTTRRTADRLQFTYSYLVRMGLLRKRYTTTVDARLVPPGSGVASAVADRADTDGRPAQYADYLIPDGEHTLFCHTYWADLKTDWLSKRFLSSHPELERLIATYSPFIVVRAIREHVANRRL